MTDVIETVQRFTPIGMDFWDLLTDSTITDGLSVSARPSAHTGRFRPASCTPAGVHSVSGIPGLRDIEFPRVAPGELADLPSGVGIDVDLLVEDRFGRFLTTVARVEAPRSGLVTSSDALAGCPALAVSLPDDHPMFLLTAPGRSIPASVASVRATLRTDGPAGSPPVPVPHAVVTVIAGGLRHIGASDENGNVLVAFPYPEFASGLDLGSTPAGSEGVPTAAQEWPVTVQIRAQPSALEFPSGVAVPRAHSLYCQLAAGVIPVAGAAADVSITADLSYGRELVLKTTGETDPDRVSYLFVEVAP